MFLRGLTALLFVAVAVQTHDTSPSVGCRNTHEWVDIANLATASVGGFVEVRYAGGDAAPLPETTVIVARVEPFIQAYVAQTDERGEFRISGVPDGRWRINVCKAGFKTLEGNLTVGDKAPDRQLRLTTELDW